MGPSPVKAVDEPSGTVVIHGVVVNADESAGA